jgi:hypothetical protein
MKKHPTMSDTKDEYTSSVTLEVDDAAETLGDSTPKTITDTERRALLQQARRARVTADVVALAHGTFDEQPATLIGLRFQFSYQPRSSNRLSSAELNISFQPDNDDDGQFPVVQRFEPTAISADATTAAVKKDTGYDLSVSVTAGPAPVSVGWTANRGREMAYVQEFRCDVIGEPWTSDEAYSKGCEVDNAVTWYLDEHKLRKEGIPREVRTVVVVGRSQSTVRAKVKTNWGLSLFGSLFSQTRPLIIGNSVAFGDQPPLNEFEKLSKEQLNAFVGLDRPFVVRDPSMPSGKHELTYVILPGDRGTLTLQILQP